MTAESVGNFSFAATGNDRNAKADAGTSCCGPASAWVCLPVASLAFLDLCHTPNSGCSDDPPPKKTKKTTNLFEGVSERGHVNGSGGKHQDSVPCWEVWLWVWWGQWKKLVFRSLCVPVHVLVEWQPTNSGTEWFSFCCLLLGSWRYRGLEMHAIGDEYMHKNYTQSDTPSPTQRQRWHIQINRFDTSIDFFFFLDTFISEAIHCVPFGLCKYQKHSS